MEVIEMYSWGTSTRDWKNPSGYKFNPARAPYLDKLGDKSKAAGPRTYSKRRSPDESMVNTLNKTIKSDSKNPIVIAVDVTGSMSKWPAEIFDRLPLLYQTLSQYRPDLEICFAAIGDAYSDMWPLQVNDFDKGLLLEDKLKALGAEGGGGGQLSESYELFGHYILNHCETPNAINPFLIIFGDEMFYDKVHPRQVKHFIGDDIKAPIKSKDVWDALAQKFNLFYLQKPFGYGDANITQIVYDYWADTIGGQKIIETPNMERAVDIAMGLIAKQWGHYGDFTENLDARQTDGAVKESVHSVLKDVYRGTDNNSVNPGPSKGETPLR